VTTNSAAIEDFVAELYRDRELAGCAQSVAHAFSALDREGDDVPDAAELVSALLWLAAQPKPLVERVGKMQELLSLTGKVVIDMQQWAEW
jgi:hypothetical protein